MSSDCDPEARTSRTRPPAAPGRQRFRPLVPAEHGTWGEILFPLLAALVTGRPRLDAWLLAAAALSGFLATESVQVLAGWRGARARRERGRDAVRSLALFSTTALACGGVALAWTTTEARVACAAAAALGAVTWTVAFAGRLKSAAGELLAGTALAAWAVPVGVAATVPLAAALALALIWAAAFGAATLAVRSLIARNTRRNGGPARAGSLALLGATVTVLGWLVARDALPSRLAVAFLPFAAFVLAVACAPIPARRLRTIGWALVAASVIFLAAMVH